jgi:hypothetical protein
MSTSHATWQSPSLSNRAEMGRLLSITLRASGIARRRTEEERAEAFFPLRATTTAADSTRDARAASHKSG